MDEKITRDEYVKQLLEQRSNEQIITDPINRVNIAKGMGLTSPTSPISTEETKLLKEYIEQKNLFNLTSSNNAWRKTLTLKKFFKMKRNQQVEVYSKCENETIYTVGKVTAVGRDFVMLSNLKDRFWIPYEYIESANVPFGIPTYSDTHQHYLYDNDLRNKLTLKFGETVSKRDTLVQIFCEDNLGSNLQTWKETWVEIRTDDEKHFGKIIETSKEELLLKAFNHTTKIPLSKITFIKTLRLLQIVRKALNILSFTTGGRIDERKTH